MRFVRSGWRLGLVGVVGVGLVSLAGCSATIVSSALQAAQYGTSTFGNGSLETVFPNTFDDTAAAVRNMVFELGLRPMEDVPGDGAIYLKLKDEGDDTITIRVRRHTRNLTSVRVRIGVFGDEPYSSAIMHRIADQLDPDKQFATPPPDLRRGSRGGGPPINDVAKPGGGDATAGPHQ